MLHDILICYMAFKLTPCLISDILRVVPRTVQKPAELLLRSLTLWNLFMSALAKITQKKSPAILQHTKSLFAKV